jgi:hypothetical protein
MGMNNKYSVARTDSPEIQVTVYCESPTQAVQMLMDIAMAGRKVLDCKEVPEPPRYKGLKTARPKWIVTTQNGWSYVVTDQPHFSAS